MGRLSSILDVFQINLVHIPLYGHFRIFWFIHFQLEVFLSVGNSSIISNAAIVAISLSVVRNYFDSSTKFIVRSIFNLIFKYFNKIVFFPCKNRIGFYLFFTALNSSIKIHNQNIDNTFKDFILSAEDYSVLLTDHVHIPRISWTCSVCFRKFNF